MRYKLCSLHARAPELENSYIPTSIRQLVKSTSHIAAISQPRIKSNSGCLTASHEDGSVSHIILLVSKHYTVSLEQQS